MPCLGTTEDSRHWFNIDFEGILSSFFLEVVMLFSITIMNFILVDVLNLNQVLSILIKVIFTLLYFVCIYLHISCMLTDPGCVPHNAQPFIQDQEECSALLKRCGLCDAFKPPKAHHCSICSRCIVKMDHHCPWINNCVGIRNMKLFLLFLLYGSVYSFLVIVMTIWCFFSHSRGSDIIVTLLGGVSFFFAVLFGMFSVSILYDCMVTALSGKTKIDRMKDDDANEGSIASRLSEVFGGDGTFSLSWFFPTSASFSEYEKLCQYSLDPLGARWNGYQSDN